MENLDLSKLKLRGFDTIAIHKQLEKYLEMMRSSDKESGLLAIGLLRENKTIMNYLNALLKPYEAEKLNWHLDRIVDPEVNLPRKLLFMFRIHLTLEKIRRGFNSFHYF
jgi:hypothetical protein